MELSGPCKILKIYISEDSRYKGNNLYHALVIKFKDMGMAGVTVTRGIEGFGKKRRLHRAQVIDLSSSLPMVIEVIDTKEQIERILPTVNEMVNWGLVIIQDVEILKYKSREE